MLNLWWTLQNFNTSRPAHACCRWSVRMMLRKQETLCDIQDMRRSLLLGYQRSLQHRGLGKLRTSTGMLTRALQANRRPSAIHAQCQARWKLIESTYQEVHTTTQGLARLAAELHAKSLHLLTTLHGLQQRIGTLTTPARTWSAQSEPSPAALALEPPVAPYKLPAHATGRIALTSARILQHPDDESPNEGSLVPSTSTHPAHCDHLGPALESRLDASDEQAESSTRPGAPHLRAILTLGAAEAQSLLTASNDGPRKHPLSFIDTPPACINFDSEYVKCRAVRVGQTNAHTIQSMASSGDAFLAMHARAMRAEIEGLSGLHVMPSGLSDAQVLMPPHGSRADGARWTLESSGTSRDPVSAEESLVTIVSTGVSDDGTAAAASQPTNLPVNLSRTFVSRVVRRRVLVEPALSLAAACTTFAPSDNHDDDDSFGLGSYGGGLPPTSQQLPAVARGASPLGEGLELNQRSCEATVLEQALQGVSRETNDVHIHERNAPLQCHHCEASVLPVRTALERFREGNVHAMDQHRVGMRRSVETTSPAQQLGSPNRNAVHPQPAPKASEQPVEGAAHAMSSRSRSESSVGSRGSSAGGVGGCNASQSVSHNKPVRVGLDDGMLSPLWNRLSAVLASRDLPGSDGGGATGIGNKCDEIERKRRLIATVVNPWQLFVTTLDDQRCDAPVQSPRIALLHSIARCARCFVPAGIHMTHVMSECTTATFLLQV
jgi:hypothetical protein